MVFDEDVSTGAADDLQRATEIALDMVTRYGMDDTVGHRAFAQSPQSFLLPQDRHVVASEVTAREIDLAVKGILERGEQLARETLARRRADLDGGVALLLTRETLTGSDFPPLTQSA